MHIETDRMILRDFTMDVADDLQGIIGDGEVMQNTEPAYDRAKTEMFLREFCVERQPKSAFAAELKNTGKVIGNVLFKSIDEPTLMKKLGMSPEEFSASTRDQTRGNGATCSGTRFWKKTITQ